MRLPRVWLGETAARRRSAARDAVVTILNFYGAETGNAIELSATGGTFDAAYTAWKRTGTYSFRSNPTTTAVGWGRLLNFTATGLSAALSVSNFFASGYFRYATKPSVNSEPLLQINPDALQLRLLSDGTLALYNSITLIASGTAVLVANTTYLIEINFNDTANTQEVKVDGTVDISGAFAQTGPVTSFFLGKTFDRNGNTVDFLYDDWCIDDAAYPGAGECKIAVPIGAGAASGWTAGTGADTFAEVDEIPHDTDTTYIAASATEDNLDHTFNMQAAATIGIAGAIGAVKTMVVARTDSITGTSTVAHRRLFNGSGFELTALGLTTTYALLAKVDVVDPSAGGGAITTADFDTIEVGMAANTLAQVQRFTAAYVTVWSAGSSAVNATVTGVTATAPATAPTGTVTAIGIASVAGVTAAAPAGAPLGSIQIATSITGVTATALAEAIIGTITAIQIATISGVTATAPADAPLGSVQVARSITGETAIAIADAPIGSVQIARSIAGETATTIADALLATITAVRIVSISGEVAITDANAIAGTLQISTSISGVTAVATASPDTVFTIFGNTSDGAAENNSVVYATARGATFGGGIDDTGIALYVDIGGIALGLGQYFWSGISTYYVGEIFVQFDTSVVSGLITNAVLSLYDIDAAFDNAFTVEIRVKDWGAALDTTDWAGGDSLSALTLVAHLDSASRIAGSYNAFINDALVANINQAGFTRLIGHSSRQRIASAPGADQLERWIFYSSDQQANTQDPKLVITTSIYHAVNAVQIASISGEPATASAEIIAGSVQIFRSITGEVAAANTEAIIGTINAIRILSISSEVAIASTDAIVGIIQTQISVSISGETATTLAEAIAGTVDTGLVASITGVTATSDAEAIAGSVQIVRSIAGEVATTNSEAFIGIAQISVSISGITATANADAIAGAIQIARAITGETATSTADAIAGTIQLVVNITGITATTITDALVATIVAQISISIIGVTATTDADAKIGSISTVNSVSISGTTATTDAEAIPGTVATGGSVVISGETSVTIADALVGTINTVRILSISGETATATGDSLPGVVFAHISTSISGVTADATTDALLATIQAYINASISGEAATTLADAIVGSVSTVRTVSISGITATTIADAIAGTINTGSNATITGEVATAITDVISGTVSAQIRATVSGATAITTADGIAAVILAQAIISIAGQIATASATAYPGTIGTGFPIVINGVTATATASVLKRQVCTGDWRWYPGLGAPPGDLFVLPNAMDKPFRLTQRTKCHS